MAAAGGPTLFLRTHVYEINISLIPCVCCLCLKTHRVFVFKPHEGACMPEPIGNMEVNSNGKANGEPRKAKPVPPGPADAQHTDDLDRKQTAIALRKWRQWAEGPYATLVGKGLHLNLITEWTVQFEEDMVKHEVPDGGRGSILHTRGAAAPQQRRRTGGYGSLQSPKKPLARLCTWELCGMEALGTTSR